MTMLSSLKKERKRTNSGSRTAYHYVRQVDKNGRPKLIVKDKYSIYDDIQSYKDDNTIEKILARVGGDISKIDFNKGVYIDVTKIPDNYTDLFNMEQQIADDYRALPVKYKEVLENNPNLYYGLAMAGKVKDFIAAIDNANIQGEKSYTDAKDMLKPENFDFKVAPVLNDNSAGGDKNV